MIVYKLKFVGDGEFIIISPSILHRLIEKVKLSPEKELSVEIDRLFTEPYQEYLLNVINSNSDEPYFSYEYITKATLTQKDLFKIAEHQLEKMKIEDSKPFHPCNLSVNTEMENQYFPIVPSQRSSPTSASHAHPSG